jgi:predicted DNA-binding transcriptional regulator AlpA
MSAPMQTEDLRTLPSVVDLPTAAAALQIGRTAAYELVRTGRWPTPVIRLGHRIKIPTAALLELLCLSTEDRSGLPVAPAAELEQVAGAPRPA